MKTAGLLFELSRFNERLIGVEMVVVVLKYSPKLPKSYGDFVVNETRFKYTSNMGFRVEEDVFDSEVV